MPRRLGYSIHVIGCIIFVLCCCTIVSKLLFAYRTRPFPSGEDPHTAFHTIVDPGRGSSPVQIGSKYTIISVPTGRTLARLDHWAILLHADSVTGTGQCRTFGMWANYSTDPITIYMASPDVHYYNIARQLNVDSATVVARSEFLGKAVSSRFGDDQNFVGTLNGLQKNILDTVASSETVDCNGIRLRRIYARFSYLGMESVLLPIRKLNRHSSGQEMNCQLLCMYFRSRPQKLLSLLQERPNE